MDRSFQQLKLKQTLQLFAQEMVNCGLSVPKAAKACGIEYNTARSYHQKPEVRAMIQDMIERKIEARKITTDWVLSELCNIAGVNISDLLDENGEVNVASLKSRAGAAVSEYTSSEIADDGRVTTRRRIKLHDKLRALEMLGRHLAMFTDKMQVEGLDNLAEEMKAARLRTEHGKS